MLGKLLVGQLLCNGRSDWICIGSKECCQSCFFFCSTGEKLFLRLVWVKYYKMISWEVDLQANDVWDLLMDIEVEDPPDCL